MQHEISPSACKCATFARLYSASRLHGKVIPLGGINPEEGLVRECTRIHRLNLVNQMCRLPFSEYLKAFGGNQSEGSIVSSLALCFFASHHLCINPYLTTDLLLSCLLNRM